MTQPTDTNQASEDELVTEVTDILNNNLHPSCECQDCIITWSDSAAIPLVVELIRTEKLKLLDKFENDCKYNYTTFGNSEKMLQVSGLLKRIEAERTKLEAEL